MKNNIRVQRAIKNITQADLAARVGVSRQTINTIESNKYVPSTLLALKIARSIRDTHRRAFYPGRRGLSDVPLKALNFRPSKPLVDGPSFCLGKREFFRARRYRHRGQRVYRAMVRLLS